MRIKASMVGIAICLTVILGSRGNANAGYWTGWFSEEAPNNQAACGWSEGIKQMACSGSYCDNMALWCDALPPGMTLDPATDHWTEWFSEEGSDTFVQQG